MRGQERESEGTRERKEEGERDTPPPPPPEAEGSWGFHRDSHATHTQQPRLLGLRGLDPYQADLGATISKAGVQMNLSPIPSGPGALKVSPPSQVAFPGEGMWSSQDWPEDGPP